MNYYGKNYFDFMKNKQYVNILMGDKDEITKYNLYREINDKVLIYNFLSGELG